MRSVTTWAVAGCLCACLMGVVGCDQMAWPPSWSQDDRADAGDDSVVALESPEQRTIRTQGETIDALTGENERLKNDIVELANAVIGLQEDIRQLEFALDRQEVVNQSLDDALDQRDRYQLRVTELTDENRQLADQVQLLKGENDDLQGLLDELNQQYQQLLDVVAAGPSTSDDDEDDDDADDDDNGDDDADDDDRSRIHFGG